MDDCFGGPIPWAQVKGNLSTNKGSDDSRHGKKIHSFLGLATIDSELKSTVKRVWNHRSR